MFRERCDLFRFHMVYGHFTVILYYDGDSAWKPAANSHNGIAVAFKTSKLALPC